MSEQYHHKQPNEIVTNNRTNSQQTAEKLLKNLDNSLLISNFAHKIDNE